MTFALRDYQREAVEAIRVAYQSGQKRCLVSMPTGTGKTVALVALLKRRLGRSLVLAHRDELLTQAASQMVRAGLEESDIGRVKAEDDEVGARIVVASVQTLARPARLQRLIDAQALCGPIETVVCDEAHHAPAESYKRIFDAFPDALLTGWTATPKRKGVDEIFGKAVYQRDIVDMIGLGWLCDLRGKQIKIKDLDLRNVRKSNGDYVESDLEEAMKDAEAHHEIVAAWQQYGEDRQTLVFVPGVDFAHLTAKTFRAVGVSAEAVDGTTPKDERKAILARYSSGETRVVTNCAVLTEGVDLPTTSCVIIGRPTKSPLLYAQQVGRGSRLYPGKKDCLVLDCVGASRSHDLGNLRVHADQKTLGDVADVEVAEDQTLFEAAMCFKERADELALLVKAAASLTAARDVDLFARKNLAWVSLPSKKATFVLGCGDEGSAAIVENGAGYNVLRFPKQGQPEVVASGLALDAATGVAEHLARDAGVLADVNARWRKLPPTDKQLEQLRKMRGTSGEGLTRGQASDLLEAGWIERRLRSFSQRGISV